MKSGTIRKSHQPYLNLKVNQAKKATKSTKKQYDRQLKKSLRINQSYFNLHTWKDFNSTLIEEKKEKGRPKNEMKHSSTTSTSPPSNWVMQTKVHKTKYYLKCRIISLSHLAKERALDHRWGSKHLWNKITIIWLIIDKT